MKLEGKKSLKEKDITRILDWYEENPSSTFADGQLFNIDKKGNILFLVKDDETDEYVAYFCEKGKKTYSLVQSIFMRPAKANGEERVWFQLVSSGKLLEESPSISLEDLKKQTDADKLIEIFKQHFAPDRDKKTKGQSRIISSTQSAVQTVAPQKAEEQNQEDKKMENKSNEAAVEENKEEPKPAADVQVEETRAEDEEVVSKKIEPTIEGLTRDILRDIGIALVEKERSMPQAQSETSKKKELVEFARKKIAPVVEKFLPSLIIKETEIPVLDQAARAAKGGDVDYSAFVEKYRNKLAKDVAEFVFHSIGEELSEKLWDEKAIKAQKLLESQIDYATRLANKGSYTDEEVKKLAAKLADDFFKEDEKAASEKTEEEQAQVEKEKADFITKKQAELKEAAKAISDEMILKGAVSNIVQKYIDPKGQDSLFDAKVQETIRKYLQKNVDGASNLENYLVGRICDTIRGVNSDANSQRILTNGKNYFEKIVRFAVREQIAQAKKELFPRPARVVEERRAVLTDLKTDVDKFFAKSNPSVIAFVQKAENKFSARGVVYPVSLGKIGTFKKETKERLISVADLKAYAKNAPYTKLDAVYVCATAMENQIVGRKLDKGVKVEITDAEREELFGYIFEKLAKETLTEKDRLTILGDIVVTSEGFKRDYDAIDNFEKNATAILKKIEAEESLEKRANAVSDKEITAFVEGTPILKEFAEQISIEGTAEAWKEYFLHRAQQEKPATKSASGSVVITASDKKLPSVEDIVKTLKDRSYDKRYAEEEKAFYAQTYTDLLTEVNAEQETVRSNNKKPKHGNVKKAVALVLAAAVAAGAFVAGAVALSKTNNPGTNNPGQQMTPADLGSADAQKVEYTLSADEQYDLKEFNITDGTLTIDEQIKAEGVSEKDQTTYAEAFGQTLGEKAGAEVAAVADLKNETAVVSMTSAEGLETSYSVAYPSADGNFTTADDFKAVLQGAGLTDAMASTVVDTYEDGFQTAYAENYNADNFKKDPPVVEKSALDLKSEASKQAVFNALSASELTFEGKTYSVASVDEIKTIMSDGETVFVHTENADETKLDIAIEGLSAAALKEQETFEKELAAGETKITITNVEEKVVTPPVVDHNANRDFAAALQGVVEGTVKDGFVEGNKVYIITDDDQLYEKTLPEGTDTSALDNAELKAAVASAEETVVYNGYNEKDENQKTELDNLASLTDSKGRRNFSDEQMQKVIANIQSKIAHAESVEIYSVCETPTTTENGWDYAQVTLKVVGRGADGKVVGTTEFTGEKVYAQGQVDTDTATLLTVAACGGMTGTKAENKDGIMHGYGKKVLSSTKSDEITK